MGIFTAYFTLMVIRQLIFNKNIYVSVVVLGVYLLGLYISWCKYSLVGTVFKLVSLTVVLTEIVLDFVDFVDFTVIAAAVLLVVVLIEEILIIYFFSNN